MIKTENLSKRFGDKYALKNLNLDIAPGEFFCFLGPNGAGKTTTIKLLTGLLHPTEGRSLVGGYDIQQDPIMAKRIIGYVPDSPFLYEKLTGWEFMRFVAGLYQVSEARFWEKGEELLRLFGILEVADQLVDDYSHGMRQKLSFASCFLHEPQIVIVDEPWVGLDPKNIRFVKDYLRQKCKEGVTIFMSTHTLSIAEEVADRIGIIHRGNMLHLGTVEEVKAVAERPGSLEDVFLELTREDAA